MSEEDNMNEPVAEPKKLTARSRFVPALVGGVAIFAVLVLCGGGLIIYAASGLFSSPSSYELSKDESADALSLRKKRAQKFEPLAKAREMSWQEYREYSAGMMDWLEYWIIPSAIELAKEGDKGQVEALLKKVEKAETVSQGLFGKIGKPEYGGDAQMATNFRGFMPTQKLAKDRDAIYKSIHIVKMIRPTTEKPHPSHPMIVNKMVDQFRWSTEMAISNARDFERDQQRQWGIKEEE